MPGGCAPPPNSPASSAGTWQKVRASDLRSTDFVGCPGLPITALALSAKRSAERTEECAHITDEEVGLLHGSEMTAAVELGPVHDVVRQLGEAPDRTGDLPRKDSQAGRRRRDFRRA